MGGSRLAPFRSQAACAVAVGFLFGVVPEAAAFVCKVSEARPHITLKWPQRLIPYGIRARSGLQPDQVTESFDRWADVPCSDLYFRYVGLVQEEDSVSQVNVIETGWVEAGFSPTAVGLTVTEFEPLTGRIVRSDVLLNEDRFEFADDGEVDCPSGAFDVRAVLTHEAGHFVGLDHTLDFSGDPGDPTMAPEVQSCETDKRSLESDDRAGICQIYPAGEVSSGCVDLPAQTEPYVRNRAFGCRAGEAPRGGAPVGSVVCWGLILAALARFGRRRDTCPPPRSGG